VKEQGERPAWLPEKYKSPEDLAKGYEESQKKLTELSDRLAKYEKGEKPEPATKREEATRFTEETKKALAEKWLKNQGSLEESDYAPFSQVGLTKDDVDLYFMGAQALVKNAVRAAQDEAGGKDALDSMVNWAKKTLPKQEWEIIERNLATVNESQAQAGSRMLRARYEMEVGRRGAAFRSTGDTSPGTTGYATIEEHQVAVNNPLYRMDGPAADVYRKQVLDKWKASPHLWKRPKR
jgi:hypothetical protein